MFMFNQQVKQGTRKGGPGVLRKMKHSFIWNYGKTRGGDVYKVSKGFSERFCKSAIPYMQRLLNKDKKKQLKELKRSTLSPTNFACT